MGNLTNNRINVSMTAAQVTAVKAAFTAIQTNTPFAVSLTTDERTSLPKIDVSNKAFTEDAINAAVNNAAMLPSYFNTATMQTDILLFSQLDEMLGIARQIVERLEDTLVLAGSESYVAALASYKLFIAAADAGVVGADAIVDQLKKRFLNSGENAPTNP